MAENENRKMDITVQVDRSAELEDKQREIENLKTEKEQLESALETIAEKALKEKCEKYNIPEDLPDEEKILKVKEAEINGSKNLTGFSSDMLNGGQKPSRTSLSGEYDSIGDMVADLTRKAKDANSPDSAVAESILKELGKVELKSVRTHGRENFTYDIDPAELKRLREESKHEVAKKRLRL